MIAVRGEGSSSGESVNSVETYGVLHALAVRGGARMPIEFQFRSRQVFVMRVAFKFDT